MIVLPMFVVIVQTQTHANRNNMWAHDKIFNLKKNNNNNKI